MSKARRAGSAALCLLLMGAAAWAVFSAGNKRVYQTTAFAMDTFIDIQFYGRHGEKAANELLARLERFEDEVSLYRPESEVAALQRKAGSGESVKLSQQTFHLLQRAKDFSLDSGGTFDITIAPVSLLWGITSDHPQVPKDEPLRQALSMVDVRDLILDARSSTGKLLRPGQSVDLGGIAKGEAANMAMQVMEECGVENGYVSLGGNLAVRGISPETGKDFLFGVRDPQGNASEYLASLPLRGLTMATTGAYERYFEQDGVKYHHILDPKTGYPAQTGLTSVTVISEDGALADYLSTALFVGGKPAIFDHFSEEVYALIVVDDGGNVYVSPSLESVLIPRTDKSQYHFIFQGRDVKSVEP